MTTTTMSVEELLKIRKWVRFNNETNPHMKVFLNIQEDVLVSADVRFFAKRQPLTKEVEDKIFNAIEILSHRRLFPEKTGDLKNGILKLNASYIHRHCGAKDIIRALEFVAKDLPAMMSGEEEI